MTRRGVAVLMLCALLGAGCGVRPSGVITGLEAPSGPAAAAPAGVPTGESGTVLLRGGDHTVDGPAR